MSDEWTAEDEIHTQDSLVSRTISFANKIRITYAFEKLIVYQDMQAKKSLEDLEKIGIKLLEKIKDVEYVGVGINFLSILKCDNPGEEINKRFLSKIPNLPNDKIIGGSVSYIYKKADVRATIAISPVKRNIEGDGAENAISFSANYHFDGPYIKKLQGFIKEMPSLQKDYQEQTKALFG